MDFHEPHHAGPDADGHPDAVRVDERRVALRLAWRYCDMWGARHRRADLWLVTRSFLAFIAAGGCRSGDRAWALEFALRVHEGCLADLSSVLSEATRIDQFLRGEHPI